MRVSIAATTPTPGKISRTRTISHPEGTLSRMRAVNCRAEGIDCGQPQKLGNSTGRSARYLGHPAGAGGQAGSGFHPRGSTHPWGGVGQLGGRLALMTAWPPDGIGTACPTQRAAGGRLPDPGCYALSPRPAQLRVPGAGRSRKCRSSWSTRHLACQRLAPGWRRPLLRVAASRSCRLPQFAPAGKRY